MNQPLIAFGMPSGIELVIVAVIALLIFGRRLPDVARSLGRSIVEFKRGVRDVKDEITTESNIDSRAQIEDKVNQVEETSAENHHKA